MSSIDETVCPYCGSDNETYMNYDFLYNKSYTIRSCDSCDKDYKVNYYIAAIEVEKLGDD